MQGFDSYVVGFTNNQDTIFFDYGIYSDNLEEMIPPDFQVFNKLINGKEFKVVIGRDDNNYIAAYTDDL